MVGSNQVPEDENSARTSVTPVFTWLYDHGGGGWLHLPEEVRQLFRQKIGTLNLGLHLPALGSHLFCPPRPSGGGLTKDTQCVG